MRQILLVCTGNTCRSAMAHGILKKLAEERGLNLEIISAGTAAMPGDSATQQAIEAMQDYGIDLTEHRSRPLNPEIIQNADVILAMTKNHRRQILARFPEAEAKTYVLKELAYANRNNDKLGQEKGEVEKNPSIDVDVNDPFGQSVEVYRKTAKEIEDALVALLDNVLEVEQ